MKNTLIKVSIFVAVVIATYVAWQTYSAYQEGERVRAEAASLITEYELLKANAAAYEKQLQPYKTERTRCTQYVKQDSGDFGEFEYCQRYLQLSQ